VVTEKGNKIYVHVLDWKDELLALPRIPGIKSASLLKNGQAVKVQQMSTGTVLQLPAGQLDPVDTIVVLEKAR
jgi:alpha-L-fucosidase